MEGKQPKEVWKAIMEGEGGKGGREDRKWEQMCVHIVRDLCGRWESYSQLCASTY